VKMDQEVKVIRNDDTEVNYSEVVGVYLGINSLSFEKSNKIIILLPYSAVKEVQFAKDLLRIGPRNSNSSSRGTVFIEHDLCPKCGKPLDSAEHSNWCT